MDRIWCFVGSTFRHPIGDKTALVELTTVRGDRWMLHRKDAATVMRALRKAAVEHANRFVESEKC